MSTSPFEMPINPFRLNWGAPGTRVYETGVDRGVLYINGVGYPWIGLTAVNEEPQGGDSNPYYIDGVKYHNGSTTEEFSATLEAYTYPDEFMYCDGTAPMMNGMFITQQRRQSFDLCYRTMIGNDIEGVRHGYKLHLVYGATATPTTKSYATMGDSPEPSSFSWKLTTRREKFEGVQFGVKYGSHVVIDSRTTYPWALEALENALYGTISSEGSLAKMPTPSELVQLFIDTSLLKITDNGDGTWTAEAPDSILSMLSDDLFQIDWPSVNFIDDTNTKFTVNNL